MKCKNEAEWWKKAVIYQIYPKSFQDSNGDGIGDLKGIIARLDYLAQLGIDVIWLSPIFASPQKDNGYDVSDYRKIDPMFGTMEDMEELIRKGEERGIRIIMDLVPNHTSNEHPWFLEAKKSRENPYHEYYIWRDGTPDCPPNDMKATFGGSAWEWVPELGQYYFHQFTVEQPDLNWENEKVRKEIHSIMEWWIAKGIGGFRIDVADQIAKVPDLKITADGPKLHEYIKEMNRAVLQGRNLVTVGEAWSATTETAKLYSNPDGSEYSMVFQFEHNCLDQQEGKEKWDLQPFSLCKLKEVFRKWQTELYGQGWNSLFWDNHDLPRIVSRWGNDGSCRVVSAKMLAILLHGLQGTPYIYQGEELGMTNIAFSIEDYRDIETINMYHERLEQGYGKEEIMRSIHAKSRDNARTPMQWDASANGGFTEGEPWIRVNPNYVEINAEAQIHDKDSIFNCYRQLIALRKENPIFSEGTFRMLLEEDTELFAYERETASEKLLVLCNFYGNMVSCPLREVRKDGTLLICSYEKIDDHEILRPYEARMYFMRK